LIPDFQEDTIRSIGSDEVSEILNAMTPDDRTALLRIFRMNLSNIPSITLIRRKEELP
jgi:Mg/Co/Ni transporter MgtE